MTAGNPKLMALLHALLARQGKVPFATYMELAMHHPEHGYYAKDRPIIGPAGDFLTAPSFHPTFGRTLWRQVKEMLQLLPEQSPRHVLEIGAGGGHMARDLLLAARDEGWDGNRLTYGIVEQSKSLQAVQRQLIHAAWPGAPVTWWPTLAAAPSTQVVLMNELMSAFAVHRLLGDDAGGWRELYVHTKAGGGLAYTLGPVSQPEAVAVLADHGIVPAPGQIADVNLGAPAFLAAIAARLAAQAFVITIDYGGPAAVVYDPRRPQGSSLRCFYRQQILPGPFVMPGYQDITADLDFDLLVTAGEQLGLSKVGLIPQGPFLLNLGIGDTAADLARRARRGDLAADQDVQKVYTLYAPEGIGESFWVLVQAKGFTEPPRLQGFRDPAPATPTLLDLLRPSAGGAPPDVTPPPLPPPAEHRNRPHHH